MKFQVKTLLVENGLEFAEMSSLKWSRMEGGHEDMKYAFINWDNVNGYVVVVESGVLQGQELM